jgi:hypothetical protein
MARQQAQGATGSMEEDEINDEEEFYAAVMLFAHKTIFWSVRAGGQTPTPDDVIDMLNERIEWVQRHKRAVERYLRRRNGPTWVRVIEGSQD